MPTLRSPAATVIISAGLMAISPAANACVLLGCLVEKITNGPEDLPPIPPASIGQAPIVAPGAPRRAAAAEKAKPVRREAARDTGRAAPWRLAMPRPAAEPRVSAEGQARREREADIRAAITQPGYQHRTQGE